MGAPEASLPNRKGQHLEVCLDRNACIETGSTRFNELRLPHRSLPEVHTGNISLETEFLGKKLELPLMISCMTGGTDEGLRLNRLLARSAGEHSLAIGTGSIRVMLRHPETRNHFNLKEFAPDSPVLANIGAAQLVEYSPARLLEAVKSIGADALYVHMNPAQELFQKDGDRDFRGWYDGLRRLLDVSRIPILVKETGAGIPPIEGVRLLDMGVSYIDVAGSGGTDWIAVETQRDDGLSDNTALSFHAWGYPTAELLLSYRELMNSGDRTRRLISNRIIASGGLRTALDFALSLGCGAWLAAAALPFIRAAAEGGMDAISQLVESIRKGLVSAIALSGAGSLDALRRVNLRVSPDLLRSAHALTVEALADEAPGAQRKAPGV